MSDSPRTQLGRILDDAAAADIPASLDLWPTIAAAARRRATTTSATSEGATPGNDWSRPALDPASRRRAAQPTTTSDDAQEQTTMSTTTDVPHDPIPIQQRRWARETLKLAAAAVVFITIGAVLALMLRDDDDTPAVSGPGPTPTPVVAPSPTVPTASQVATPTDAAQPSPTATERPQARPTATKVVPTPVVIGPPASDLPVAGQINAAIPVGDSPLAIAAGHGAIWVQNDRDGTLSRIDPATNAVVATIPIARPLGPDIHTDSILFIRQSSPDLAIDATSVWVNRPEEQSIVQVDPETNTVVATIALQADATAVVVDGSSLWVALFGASSVVRIDTATGQVVATIPNVPAPAGIAVAQDAVWVTNHMSDTVTRIDPETNEIVAHIAVDWQDAPRTEWECGLCVTKILADEHGIWVTLRYANLIGRIDPATNQLAAVIPVGIEPRSLASDTRGVWVGHQSSMGVLLIDPATNQVTSAVPATDAPNELPWIALAENTLWAARSATNDIARIELQPE